METGATNLAGVKRMLKSTQQLKTSSKRVKMICKNWREHEQGTQTQNSQENESKKTPEKWGRLNRWKWL